VDQQKFETGKFRKLDDFVIKRQRSLAPDTTADSFNETTKTETKGDLPQALFNKHRKHLTVFQVYLQYTGSLLLRKTNMPLLTCSGGCCGLHCLVGVCLAATLTDFGITNRETKKRNEERLTQQKSSYHQERYVISTLKKKDEL
jgi:hypothetical protein